MSKDNKYPSIQTFNSFKIRQTSQITIAEITQQLSQCHTVSQLKSVHRVNNSCLVKFTTKSWDDALIELQQLSDLQEIQVFILFKQTYAEVNGQNQHKYALRTLFQQFYGIIQSLMPQIEFEYSFDNIIEHQLNFYRSDLQQKVKDLKTQSIQFTQSQNDIPRLKFKKQKLCDYVIINEEKDNEIIGFYGVKYDQLTEKLIEKLTDEIK
ncbi:Hypothetical_protein [Hexamita inflata]|uniref:Hypothetical_protein n=1 Tax=Hexamita inflata TaxID=28002 RepID=A0ABP1H225_9EUKA